MKKISILFLCSIIFSLTACNDDYPDLDDGLYAEFKTNQGDFVARLHHEATPMTVASFVSLAEGKSEMVSEEQREKKFYNGLTFHRVIEDFMIQGGDPTGTGTGGPGYKFPNEIVDTLQHDSKGILSMANSGPDTNGSQFFITLKETPWLDGMHTVFGKVVQGEEVIDQIGAIETDEGDRPVQEVVMEEVNIIRKGSSAKNFDAAKVLNTELENMEAKAEEEAKRLEDQKAANEERFGQLEDEAEELESGLKIHFIEKGEGEKPKIGETVMVNYTGYLDSGEIFDSNIEQVAEDAGILNKKRQEMDGYQPMAVLYSPDAPMIPGFREGIQQMKVGDKAVLFIPAHLGYGERGAPPVIPPNADLIFEVEIVSVQE